MGYNVKSLLLLNWWAQYIIQLLLKNMLLYTACVYVNLYITKRAITLVVGKTILLKFMRIEAGRKWIKLKTIFQR